MLTCPTHRTSQNSHHSFEIWAALRLKKIRWLHYRNGIEYLHILALRRNSDIVSTYPPVGGSYHPCWQSSLDILFLSKPKSLAVETVQAEWLGNILINACKHSSGLYHNLFPH